MTDQLAITDTGDIISQPLTWDGEPLWSPDTVREGLFDAEAFEQMPGQIAMEEPSAVKNYYVTHNVGKVRYAVNFHDGVKTHGDGSRFYDLRIASNKRELSAIIGDLERSGYVERLS